MNGYRMPTHGDMGMVLQGNAQGQLSISGTAAQTSAFTEAGYFDLWCDVDAYVKVAPTADNVTTSTGYLIRANTTYPNIMVLVGDKIGAIAGGAGTLRYHKVS
ncbi:MAG: hypothetical protein E6Q97_27080 [Desulfurellales bacterium]|nr:MAG: hypothetical protein E6Q97_27080 [Desulfurellales bacterium]